MISVKFRGIRELEKRFGKFPTEMRKIMGDAVLNGAEVFADEVLREAPVRAGTLKDSISIRYRWPDEAWIFIAEPAHTYALFIESGTRPHLIKPVSAKALKFDVDGIVFAKYVHHPGTRPDPFMKRSYEAGESKVKRIFEQATEKMVSILAL